MDGNGRGASVLALLAIGTTALVGIKDVPWLFWLAMAFYIAAAIVFLWPWLAAPKLPKKATASPLPIGDTLVATGSVGDTLTYGEAFRYLMNEAQASQHDAWRLLENAIKRGMVHSIGRESTFWPLEGDASPPLFSAEWRHVTEQEWADLHGPSLLDAIDKTPRLPFPHCAFPTREGGHGFGYLRVSESDLERVWPPHFSQTNIKGAAAPSPGVPLMEAAIRAYEQTRGSPAADMAERQGGQEQLLTWYCYAFWGLLTLEGTPPPSRISELIPQSLKSSFSFEVDDKEIVLSERHGNRKFTNLKVSPDALQAAIAKIAKWGTKESSHTESRNVGET